MADVSEAHKEVSMVDVPGTHPTARSVHHTLEQAMDLGLRCEVEYNGSSRIVEPHCLGTTRKGKLACRVWQVVGPSTSGEYSGWKLLLLDEIYACRLLDNRTEAPRPGYKMGDSAFATIDKQIETQPVQEPV